MIRGRLVEGCLFSRSTRSVPLLKKKELCRKYFAWTNKRCGLVLRTDESKINIFGLDGKQFDCRPPNKEFDSSCIKKQ